MRKGKNENMITTEQIKDLRNKTNISITQCKKALEEAGGDIEKALFILRNTGAKIAGKKAEREVKAGIIDSYIHSNKQVGVLIDVRCETDFVAKNEDFQAFVHNVAMHVAALGPLYIKKSDVPQDEKEEIKERVLLDQLYVKNPNITVGEYLKETIQKFGENIKIKQFIRYSLK